MNKSKDIVYYENWLLKKEGVSNWIMYWGIIRGKWLQLFEWKNTEVDNSKLVKTFELSSSTQCSLIRRKKKRFPFSIRNGAVTYYMKSDTEIERYHWIFSLLTSVTGKPKSPLPKFIPESMVEKEVFKEIAKEKPSSENVPQSKPVKKESEYLNRRRERFAMRNELRQQRKAAKQKKQRQKELEKEIVKKMSAHGQWPRELNHSDSKTLNVTDKTLKSRSTETLSRKGLKSSDIIKKSKSSENLHQRDTMKKRSKKTDRIVKVDVVMDSSNKVINVLDNLAFEDDEEDDNDNEDINDMRVFLETEKYDVSLPNVVFTQFSESDSDTDNTIITRVNSQLSLFSNYGSCSDISSNLDDTEDLKYMYSSLTNVSSINNSLHNGSKKIRVQSASARLVGEG